MNQPRRLLLVLVGFFVLAQGCATTYPYNTTRDDPTNARIKGKQSSFIGGLNPLATQVDITIAKVDGEELKNGWTGHAPVALGACR